MEEYLRVHRWFSILYYRSQNFISEACKPLNLTYSEYTVLMNLYDNEGMNQDELSNSLMLDKTAVARTVAQLEAKGFLYRTPDAHDRRQKRLYLLPAALAHKDFFLALLIHWEDYLSQDKSDLEIDTFIDCLQAFSARALLSDFSLIAKESAMSLGGASDDEN